MNARAIAALVVALGVPIGTGCDDSHQYRCRNYAAECHQEQNQAEGARDSVDKLACIVMAVLFAIARHYRHEALRKSAFCEKSAQHIGNPVGHDERIHDDRRTKKTGKDDIANEAQDS